MSAGVAPPPLSCPLPLCRRQYLLCLLAGAAGFMAARHWLLPKWGKRAEAGTVTIAHALDQAVSETVGVVLVCSGAALFVCMMFNLIRRERRRRSEAAARELAFVASLGQRSHSTVPSNSSLHPRDP